MTTREDIEELAGKIDHLANNQPAKFPRWLLPVILSALGVIGSVTMNYVFTTKPEAKTAHEEIVEVLSEKMAEQSEHGHPVQQEINKNFERRMTAQEKLIDRIEYNVIVIGERVGAGRRLRRTKDAE